MRSQREGGLSAITKVKVFSPEISNIAQGQGFHILEANIAARVKGERVSGLPGSKSMAGNPIVHIGTWENHIVPDVSVHHWIVSLHRGIAALHRAVVTLHYDIVGLHYGVVNWQKGL
jgi:hypothetical protein